MFIDEILPKYPDMPKPQIFNIQNVADYIFKSGITKYALGIEDCFSFRPPFPCTWFEFVFDWRVNLKDKGWTRVKGSDGLPPVRHGAHCTWQTEVVEDKIIPRLEVVWVSEVLGMVYGHHIYCDATGKYIEDPEAVGFSISDKEHMSEGEEAWFHNFYGQKLLSVLITALNFLHCKNVVAVEQPIPAALLKARNKKGKPYFEKTYTLAIEPMRKALATKGKASTEGLKYAFHICRGHFKEYSEKGLFGKYKGMFWYESHTRGSKAKGRINKTYSIKVPNDER